MSEAYEVLSDSSRRQEYDTFGMHGGATNAGPFGARAGPQPAGIS